MKFQEYINRYTYAMDTVFDIKITAYKMAIKASYLNKVIETMEVDAGDDFNKALDSLCDLMDRRISDYYRRYKKAIF